MDGLSSEVGNKMRVSMIHFMELFIDLIQIDYYSMNLFPFKLLCADFILNISCHVFVT